MKKVRILLPLLLALLCLTMTACTAQPKTFTKDGISVTCDSSFKMVENESLTMFLDGKVKGISALKEIPSSAFPISKALREYTQAVLSSNNLTKEVSNFSEGGVVFDYFAYEKTIEGKDYYYLAVTKKSTTAFYLFNFFCEQKNAEKFEPVFLDWAKLITVE